MNVPVWTRAAAVLLLTTVAVPEVQASASGGGNGSAGIALPALELKAGPPTCC